MNHADARTDALRQAAAALDTLAVNPEAPLSYDIASALIGIAHDVRQGALALHGAPGAAEIYLRSADRCLKDVAADHFLLAREARVVRALEEVAATVAALTDATEDARPQRRRRSDAPIAS
jgi:hypothetical protein